ncbi:UPAR/Ly6 domain-containing protein crok-like [Arctopsyche grandis]|uniref:UPAR/Ly6 domain-containing protein crok-like n=1 Tax=Arctopsyche grandis TaxID=121162 RepID=UPI00406D891F
MTKSRGIVGGVLVSCLLMLIFETYQVSGITCYQCNSGYDPRCGDPFDPYSLATINCSLKQPLDHLSEDTAVLCRKTIQKVYGKFRVIRECGYITDKEHDNKACVRRSGTHDVFAWYCSCTSDLCNNGFYQLPNRIMTAAGILVTIGVARYTTASHITDWSL